MSGHRNDTGMNIPVTTNVPSIRLANGYYTSPAGEFGVRIPKLMVPGTRIEERQIDQTTWSVSFADDFGRIYEVLVSETPSPHPTLEDVARNLPVGGRFSARSFIDTVRGRELRLAGVEKGGSPLVRRREKIGGGWDETRNDLAEAWSIFLHDSKTYAVKVGITPLWFCPEEMGEHAVLVREQGVGQSLPTIDKLMEEAKHRLATFLGTFSLPAAADPRPEQSKRPNPSASQYVRTQGAGFVMSTGERSINYAIFYAMRESLASPLVARVA